MYADSPGMIYYEFVDRNQGSQEEDPVMSSEEEKAYKDAQLAVLNSILNQSGALESMIEAPDSDDWFCSLFSPEAIMKAILGGNVPMGLGGSMCSVFA